jgi:hypothetical protein
MKWRAVRIAQSPVSAIFFESDEQVSDSNVTWRSCDSYSFLYKWKVQWIFYTEIWQWLITFDEPVIISAMYTQKGTTGNMLISKEVHFLSSIAIYGILAMFETLVGSIVGAGIA